VIYLPKNKSVERLYISTYEAESSNSTFNVVCITGAYNWPRLQLKYNWRKAGIKQFRRNKSLLCVSYVSVSLQF